MAEDPDNEQVDFEEGGIEEPIIDDASEEGNEDKKETGDRAVTADGFIPYILFMSRFASSTKTSDVEEFMGKFGKLVSCVMKGEIAFAEFENVEDAKIAKETCHLQPGLGVEQLVVDYKREIYRPSRKIARMGRGYDRRDYRDRDRDYRDDDRRRDDRRDREYRDRERSRSRERGDRHKPHDRYDAPPRYEGAPREHYAPRPAAEYSARPAYREYADYPPSHEAHGPPREHHHHEGRGGRGGRGGRRDSYDDRGYGRPAGGYEYPPHHYESRGPPPPPPAAAAAPHYEARGDRDREYGRPADRGHYAAPAYEREGGRGPPPPRDHHAPPPPRYESYPAPGRGGPPEPYYSGAPRDHYPPHDRARPAGRGEYRHEERPREPPVERRSSLQDSYSTNRSAPPAGSYNDDRKRPPREHK